MMKLKMVDRTPCADDGKRWIRVDVTENYYDSYLVRATDEEEAYDMVNDLINTDEIDPSASGMYERSVEPTPLAGAPDVDREYWVDEE